MKSESRGVPHIMLEVLYQMENRFCRSVLALLVVPTLAACGPGRGGGLETAVPADEADRIATGEYWPGLDPQKTLDQYRHEVWQVEDGLPQNSVEAIVQTGDGYLWLGTQEGLVRFDGSSFTVLDRSNTPWVTNNHISVLLEGGDGELWVGTYGGGLIRFEGMEATSYTVEDGLSDNSVVALADDGRGGIWIGTFGGGLDHMEGGRFTSYTKEDGLPGNHVRALQFDRDGNLWVGTTEGLARLHGGAVDIPAELRRFAGVDVTAIASGREGEMWVGTITGLNRLEEGRWRTYRASDGLCSDFVLSLHVDRDGNVWIGTVGGLNRLRDGRFSSFTSKQGLKSDMVLSLLVDREGTLWIGTEGGGLNQLREAKFATYTTFHGLSDDDIYTVAGSRRGGFWAGSRTGDIDRFEGGRFHPVLPGPLLGSAQVRTLHEDRAGNLWIGTERALHKYTAERLTTYTGDDGLPNAPVRVVFEDRDGTVWVGTDGVGLYRFHEGRLLSFEKEEGLPSDVVRAIHHDRAGNLWVGTYGGLSMLKNGRFITYSVADGLSHNYVRTIYETEDGSLWIGTYGGGLTRLKDGEFTAYTTREGLFSDVIYQILEDEDGYFWMSCNKGIFRVARSELEDFAAGLLSMVKSEAFAESDGMQNRECNGGCPAGCITDGDKHLWFPTIHGVVEVDPANLRLNRTPPPVVVERVVVDDEVIDHTAAQVLSPRRKRLEFYYAALSFVAPEKVRYQYMLEGFEQDWHRAGSNRVAQYTRLPPGPYRFRVIASNSDGVWNETGASFDFELEPAFYQTALFFWACVMMLLVVGTCIYWRYIHGLKMKGRALQMEVEEAETQIRVLSGMLPICANCKRIRDDEGQWGQMEIYIRDHSEAEFSHGLCPDCLRELYPEYRGKQEREL